MLARLIATAALAAFTLCGCQQPTSPNTDSSPSNGLSRPAWSCADLGDSIAYKGDRLPLRTCISPSGDTVDVSAGIVDDSRDDGIAFTIVRGDTVSVFAW